MGIRQSTSPLLRSSGEWVGLMMKMRRAVMVARGGVAVALALGLWGGSGCDEDFNDIYAEPVGGAAGVGGGAGSSGQGGGSCGEPRCQGSAREVCEAGEYRVVQQCALGCGGGECVSVVQLAMGRAHGCARLSDESVRCWGENAQGQLGSGEVGAGKSAPVVVQALAGVTGLALGEGHGCGLREGKVLCWGKNDDGQCGPTASGEVQASPVEVPLAKAAVQVAVGAAHGCARMEDATVACWGSNRQGQLGASAPEGGSATPVVVAGVSGVVAVAAGGRRSCVVDGAQSVRCWGEAPTEEAASEVFAPEVKAVSELAQSQTLVLGGFHACGLASGGTIRCAGANQSGQLGNGMSTTSATVVDGVGKTVAGAVSLAAGTTHQCALRGDTRTVVCWGDNDKGQLGKTGDDVSRATPVPIAIDVGQVACGGQSCCAVAVDGQTMQCWGENAAGQLGLGKTSVQEPPTKVSW